MTAIPVGSHLDVRSRKLIGLRDGLQWYQTFTLHAVGTGQQDMGIWVPYDSYLVKLRYRVASVGSGGAMSVDLRLNGTDTGNVITGTNLGVSTAPTWTTLTAPGVSLAAGIQQFPMPVVFERRMYSATQSVFRFYANGIDTLSWDDSTGIVPAGNRYSRRWFTTSAGNYPFLQHTYSSLAMQNVYARDLRL